MEILTSFARAIRDLPWADMVVVSEHIADQVPRLQKSEALDRDGVAQLLDDMAKDIITKAEADLGEDGR